MSKNLFEKALLIGTVKRRLAVSVVILAIASCGVVVGVSPFGSIIAAACEDVGAFPLSGIVCDKALYKSELLADGPTVEGDRPIGESDAIEAPSDPCAEVPEMVQYPDMPAGCEVYSLTAVLRSLGLDAGPHRIADDYIPFNVVDGFVASAYRGSPYVVGGEGLLPAIVRAGNAFLEDTGSDVRLSDATESSLEELEQIASEGSPVLIWTTMSLRDPGLAAPLPAYSFYSLEHCLVLLGSEGSTVNTMDPMVGFASYDRATFSHIYEQCGSMAVTLAR